MSFFVPSSTTTSEIIIKNSRFIATVFPCISREILKEKYYQLEQAHPKARHYCWAMICKEPNDSSGYGFSDDGEPSGTAGKPIFNVLHHQNIGHCGIIVTRYFGGIKLGTGGLVKAYTEATKQGLDTANLTPFTPSITLTLTLPFSQESNLHHLCKEFNATLLDTTYTTYITATLTLNQEKREDLEATLTQYFREIHLTQ